MGNRLRQWDDGFERRFDSLTPKSWRVRDRSYGSGLIGTGLAYITLGPLLLLVLALNDRSIVVPAVFVVLGLVALPIGILINRRRDEDA